MQKQLVAAVVLLCAACSQGSSPDKCAAVSCLDGARCVDGACVLQKCGSTSQCPSGLLCDDAICQTPACGGDAECTGGQVCVSGRCSTPPAAAGVASCEITPNPSVVRAGATTQLAVIAKDSAGKAVRFSSFTWAGSSPGGSVDANGLVTGAGTGDVTATATAQGSSASCSALVHGYAASTTALRVTVIDMHTRQPLKDAEVVIDNGTVPSRTAADGTVSFSGVTAAGHDVHVFRSGYSYTSFAAVPSLDVLVPLTPYVAAATRSGFTAHMCETKAADPACDADSEFAPLRIQGESVHLAFFGSGIPNSLLDLSASTLLGPSHPVTLNFGSATTANLPYGLVLGVGPNFNGTQDYRVFADAGARALWGLGGNLPLGDVTTVLAPVLAGGGSVDTGVLLPQLLPLFSRTQAGAVVGVHAPVNGTSAFTKQPVPLNTPLRLRTTLVSPDLPALSGTYLDGVIAVAGAMAYPVGFVPLGLTAASSIKDGQNKNTAKVADPNCTGTCPPGEVSLRVAPPNNGTEGSKIGVAVLALNFGALSAGSTQRVALSGVVNLLDSLSYNGASATRIDNLPAFLTFPDLAAVPAPVAISKSARTLTLRVTATRREIYRFEIANAAGLIWNVWVAPDPAGNLPEVRLPDPSLFSTDPLPDPFQDPVDPTKNTSTARLLRMQLRIGLNAGNAESFGALTLDQIGANLQAFSALQIDVGP